MDSNKDLLYNGIYDGKSFYIITDCKVYRHDAKKIINDPIKILFREPSVRKILNWWVRHNRLYYKTITKYIDSNMKTFFKTKLLLSDDDTITFNVVETEDGFDIDIDSIH